MRLGAVIADYRWANRMGGRELAKEIGVSHSTLNRFENGENCDGETLVKIMTWLFAAAEPRQKRRQS